ncbi:hypothetical protein ACH40F_16550 [Streptomyces sp. NPDC020794]|uniref:hypothetical protein n=1 Tax=unclassified Streptomyces TaxID=2593676 RepID=UPI0036EAB5BD
MSSIVKFFVASREGATDALSSGPDSSLRAAVFGNFDAEEALLDWESSLTGIPFESLVESDLPEVVAEVDDGPMVFRLSDELVSSLTSASSSGIHELALWWVGEKSANGIEIELPIALGILQSLVDLTRSADESGMGVYCWTS